VAGSFSRERSVLSIQSFAVLRSASEKRLVGVNRIVQDCRIAASAHRGSADGGGDHLAPLVIHKLTDLIPIASESEFAPHPPVPSAL
jgi:hypothetical protein